jgi:hypothetical protein
MYVYVYKCGTMIMITNRHELMLIIIMKHLFVKLKEINKIHS